MKLDTSNPQNDDSPFHFVHHDATASLVSRVFDDPATLPLCQGLVDYSPADGYHQWRVGWYFADLLPDTQIPFLVGEDELVSLVRGAFVHDVGKVGLDSALLSKKNLSLREKRALRRHPRITGQLLSRLGLSLENLLQYRHHENSVVGAYPRSSNDDGGNRVPVPTYIVLAGELLTVVDRYEAAVFPRPYQAGPCPVEALQARLLRNLTPGAQSFVHSVLFRDDRFI